MREREGERKRAFRLLAEAKVFRLHISDIKFTTQSSPVITTYATHLEPPRDSSGGDPKKSHFITLSP